MADRLPDPDDIGVRPTTDRPPSAPRWVKVFGIIIIVVVVVVVAMRFMGGEHGPGRHASSGDAGDQAPPSSVLEDNALPERGRG